jgi:hypothetical protein
VVQGIYPYLLGVASLRTQLAPQLHSQVAEVKDMTQKKDATSNGSHLFNFLIAPTCQSR